MLGALRKFSSSIYAKLFLLAVAIPFIFWGMGPLFTSGNLNTVAHIDNEKIPTKEFINFLKLRTTNQTKITKNLIERNFADFLGEKLIHKQVEDLKISISDKSLKEIIINEKIFQKDNKFSRTKYEKFLIENNITSVTFEENYINQERRKQLFDFIGGGVVPSEFLINDSYNKINQSRNIEIINFKNTFKKEMNFLDSDIVSYYNEKKDDYKNKYIKIKFIKLNPKNLTGSDEFDNIFFQKIDEIDDLIVEGRSLDFIVNKFNLQEVDTESFIDDDINVKEDNKKIPKKLIEKIFSINEDEPIVLFEHEDNFFVIEINENKIIKKDINDENVKKDILIKLKNKKRIRLISEIISKINKNNFKKEDFFNFAKKENVKSKKIKIKNLNDDSNLKKNIIAQIYQYPSKSVTVVADLGLSDSYLVYIDSIENVSIDKKFKDYKEYYNLSEMKIKNSLFNTYDSYLGKKYKIDINYKALENITNNY